MYNIQIDLQVLKIQSKTHQETQTTAGTIIYRERLMQTFLKNLLETYFALRILLTFMQPAPETAVSSSIILILCPRILKSRLKLKSSLIYLSL